MKRVPRSMAWIAVGVAAIAALFFLLRPAPLAVELGAAAVAPLRETVGGEGMTRVRDRYVVAAPIAGRVLRLTLQEGDAVRRDQPVAVIYPSPLDAAARHQALAQLALAEDAAQAAAATVEAARVALAQARRDLARAETLRASSSISAEALEQAQLAEATRQREVESADFRAQAAAHDVEAARAAARESPGEAITLRAPVAGRVLRIAERSERVVAAGEALVEIGDPTRLEMVADLLSSDAVRVKAGDEVIVSGWGGAPIRARVRLVEPSGFTKVSALGVEEQRVNVIADFITDPPALGDRFRVELAIVTWEGTVLQVPASAVFRHGDGWAVFTIARGRAQLTPVEIGHRTSFAVEIIRGVARGDAVIRDPSDRVTDGVRITADR